MPARAQGARDVRAEPQRPLPVRPHPLPLRRADRADDALPLRILPPRAGRARGRLAHGAAREPRVPRRAAARVPVLARRAPGLLRPLRHAAELPQRPARRRDRPDAGNARPGGRICAGRPHLDGGCARLGPAGRRPAVLPALARLRRRRVAYSRQTISLAECERQLSGITNGRAATGDANLPFSLERTVGTVITKSLPKSRRALPEIVFVTSPIRSFMFASDVSVSFIRIRSTISIERGAVKQTAPLRLPETPITPMYSCTLGGPSVTRYGEPTATGWRAATSK